MEQENLKPNLNSADLTVLSELLGNLLEKQSEVLVSKKDLQNGLNSLEAKIDSKLNNKIDSLELRLKSYIHEGMEMVMAGMDSLVRDDKIGDKLSLKIKRRL